MSMATLMPPDMGGCVTAEVGVRRGSGFSQCGSVSHFHKFYKNYEPMGTLLGPLPCSEGSLASDGPVAP